MHCVFYAIKDHLEYLGIETLYDDWLIYEGARIIAGNRGDTSLCIVPFIGMSISLRHNLEYRINLVEPFNIKWLRSQAIGNEKTLVRYFSAICDNSEEEGIYFPKFTMHAQFLLKPPKEDYVMKILFKEK